MKERNRNKVDVSDRLVPVFGPAVVVPSPPPVVDDPLPAVVEDPLPAVVDDPLPAVVDDPPPAVLDELSAMVVDVSVTSMLKFVVTLDPVLMPIVTVHFPLSAGTTL